MKIILVTVCALAMAEAVPAPARGKRGFSSLGGYSLGYSGGYSGGLGLEGGLSGVGVGAPVVSIAAPAAQLVSVNKVVNVPKVVSVPQVVTVSKVVSVPQVVSVNKVVEEPSIAISGGSIGSVGGYGGVIGGIGGYGGGIGGGYSSGWW